MARSRLTLVVAFVVVWAQLATAASASAPPAPIRLGYCGGDDWEPAVVAQGKYVYVAITHYEGSTTCDPQSGNPRAIYIQVSSDKGATFTTPHVVYTGSVGGVAYSKQADPTIAVDGAGNVYVAFLGYGLNGGHTDVVVARSTDHGATFSSATKVNSQDCKNCDHEKMVVSGTSLYVAYTQASGHFIALSSDGATTWAQSEPLRADVVAFAEGGVVDGLGSVYFAWADCQSSNCTGVPAVDYRVSKTAAGTLNTTFASVGTAVQGPDCPYSSCGFAYWGPQSDIAIDAGGTLYLAWQQGQAPTTRKSPPIVNLSRSTNGGQTWNLMGRADDKTASGCPGSSCYALYPTIVGGPANTVYVAWMDDRNGQPVNHQNGFNVWLRTSATGGASWTGPSLQISAYDPTQSQSTPSGFLFPYGDYMGLVMAGCGAPMLTWGEGHNWVGGPSAPGHVEFRTPC
jgi:hypothetical protein